MLRAVAREGAEDVLAHLPRPRTGTSPREDRASGPHALRQVQRQITSTSAPPRPRPARTFISSTALTKPGKSTAAAALLDLLYGIEKHSSYGAAKGQRERPQTWHRLRRDADRRAARTRGGANDVARIKRDQGSLSTPTIGLSTRASCSGDLGGLDREAFRTMFSLDDDSLEKGGEAILASKGELGLLLFSASAGLAEIGGRLESLRRKANEFYRPSLDDRARAN